MKCCCKIFVVAIVDVVTALAVVLLILLAELLSRYRYSHWGCRSCGISSLSYHVDIAYTAGVVVNLLGTDVGTTTAVIAVLFQLCKNPSVTVADIVIVVVVTTAAAAGIVLATNTSVSFCFCWYWC